MLWKFLLLAAVIVMVLFGWKRIEGMARKANRLVNKVRDEQDAEPIDLERDPESGAYRRQDRD
ncbi:MAG: hypothetical protein OXF26_11435 [Alphaproteobacteria bacterium]|nr:hypothetical protein [Alphaproteobacteria bacterium]MCY4320517.1 hypothetical protein [Alphaproteobacteria bacterium]